MKPLDLTGFEVVMTHPTVLLLPNASVESDGDDWGTIPLADAQKRLEDEDDLAILVLRTSFDSAEELEGMTIEVNAEGLRSLEVDGTYLVPRAGEAPEGFERYELPSPLKAGPHPVQWSFVWQPPVDQSSGEKLDDGVTLVPLRIQGLGAARDGNLVAAPKTADLKNLAACGLEGASEGLSFEKDIELPTGAKALHLQGAGAGSFTARIDDQELPAEADATGRFLLPPGTDGKVKLTLAVQGTAASLSGLLVEAV